MGLTGVKARSELHLTLKLHWLKLVSNFVIEYPRRNDHCKVEYMPNLDTCQRAKMLPPRKLAVGTLCSTELFFTLLEPHDPVLQRRVVPIRPSLAKKFHIQV